MPTPAPIRLRVVGDRTPAFQSHRELDAALVRLPAGVEARWCASDDPAVRDLTGIHGVWIAPGSPYRDDAAVLDVLRQAREGGVPLLATCGGLQYAALELARNLAGLPDAAHAEVSPDAPAPVVERLACSLFAQVRTVHPVPGTRFAALVGTSPFPGTHFCNFGLAEAHVPRLVAAGVVVTARAEDAGVEGFELPRHPFYQATLFQPQIGALAGAPTHPLVLGLVEAARVRASAGSGR
ncbi:MAG: gamma-glutamyl-gamma-aminobutyrate hydrolase family protein [Anaeromyxobacter sp.]